MERSGLRFKMINPSKATPDLPHHLKPNHLLQNTHFLYIRTRSILFSFSCELLKFFICSRISSTDPSCVDMCISEAPKRGFPLSMLFIKFAMGSFIVAFPGVYNGGIVLLKGFYNIYYRYIICYIHTMSRCHLVTCVCFWIVYRRILVSWVHIA